MNTPHITADTSSWIRGFAKLGLIAKGIVYSLSGILALMAALHLGGGAGKNADKTGVFNFIYEQPMGKVLLGIVALGLLCYSAWRLIQGIKDTEDKGTDVKGLGRRAAYIFSGLIYLSVAFYAGKLVLTQQKENGNGQKELAADLLSKPFGQALMWIAAAIMVGSGVVQLHRGLSGKYKEHVKDANYGHQEAKGWLIKTGMAGYIARGIVWFIIGWFFVKAAYKSSPEEAGGSGNALQWLEQWQYGSVLLGAVAAGLVCYGIFIFVRARYQPINT